MPVRRARCRCRLLPTRLAFSVLRTKRQSVPTRLQQRKVPLCAKFTARLHNPRRLFHCLGAIVASAFLVVMIVTRRYSHGARTPRLSSDSLDAGLQPDKVTARRSTTRIVGGQRSPNPALMSVISGPSPVAAAATTAAANAGSSQTTPPGSAKSGSLRESTGRYHPPKRSQGLPMRSEAVTVDAYTGSISGGTLVMQRNLSKQGQPAKIASSVDRPSGTAR